MSDDNTPDDQKPDLEEGLDEFLNQVGSELDPLQALANALTRCGKTQFALDGETMVIGQGAQVCEGLAIQDTTRSHELFCTTCGISCEVRILEDRQSTDEEKGEADEMDEFLNIVQENGSESGWDDDSGDGY